jgi:hypothetical protein
VPPGFLGVLSGEPTVPKRNPLLLIKSDLFDRNDLELDHPAGGFELGFVADALT